MGDSLQRANVGAGRTVKQLTSGAHHVCARLDDGTLKCWGNNQNGELGLGDTQKRGDGPGEMGDALPAVRLGAGRTVVDVRAGFSHTCARLDDGALKCWGYNFGGPLGLGDTNDRGTLTAHMGDALPAVALGTGRKATGFACGLDHTCALLDDGTLKCWGSNNSGQLGLGTRQVAARARHVQHDRIQKWHAGRGNVVPGSWVYAVSGTRQEAGCKKLEQGHLDEPETDCHHPLAPPLNTTAEHFRAYKNIA